MVLGAPAPVLTQDIDEGEALEGGSPRVTVVSPGALEGEVGGVTVIMSIVDEVVVVVEVELLKPLDEEVAREDVVDASGLKPDKDMSSVSEIPSPVAGFGSPGGASSRLRISRFAVSWFLVHLVVSSL